MDVTLTIRLFEGRSFDKLPPNHAVRVQAVLNNLVQETSPASNNTTKTFGNAQPIWNNDNSGLLTWTLSKTELQQLQKSGGSLKLYCFSTTRRSQGTATDEQSLGYVLLNLNSPQYTLAESENTPEWHKLRGISRTMELKLRATINTTLSTSPTHQSTTGKRNAFNDVVVSEDAEFIPIGTGGATATDVFTLDVTLAGVDQLKGIATTISGPYYLTYGMFGVVTETDTFDSLSHPIFHPIVDSFRVQSNRAELSHFFGHEVLPLEIKVVGAGNQIVAVAKVDCSPLSSAIGAKEFHGAELEGTYPFHSIDQTLTVTTGKPILFAAVAVRPLKEVNELQENGNEKNKIDTTSRKNTVVDVVEDVVEDLNDSVAEGDGVGIVGKSIIKVTTGANSNFTSTTPPQEKEKEEEEEEDSFEDDFEDDESDEPSPTAATATAPTTTTTTPTTTAPSNLPLSPSQQHESEKQTTKTLIEEDSDNSDIQSNPLRRYRLSVDLRSIRNVATPSTVYLSYTLPTFGAISSVRTRPPIALTKNSESLLPHGYQCYEVCLTRTQVHAALKSTPLTIDLVRKDKYQTDTPLGTATIPLTELMTTTKFYRDSKTRKTFSSFAMLRSFQKSGSNTNTTIPTTASNKTSSSTKYVTVRTDDRYVQVLTSNDGGRISKVASLRVVVILEDLGISSSNKSSSISTLETISNVAVTASARLSPSNATRQHPNARTENANAFGYATTNTSNRNLTQNTSNNNIQGNQQSPYDPAEDPKNQEALQEWVQTEYHIWETGMKRKEMERMNVLENVWRQREEERTIAINTVQKSYNSLESSLRHKLDSVENRERALHLKELELTRRTEVQSGELKIQQRRLEEELSHKISIEKRKVEELTTRVKHLTKNRNQSEERCRKVEKDFANYRHEQRSTPEAVLHARVTELTSKISELTVSVDVQKNLYETEKSSKIECQAQLGRLVRELQAMRRKERIVSERNMEQLRLQYIAREERYVLDGDRQELRSIKNELDDLRRATTNNLRNSQGRYQAQGGQGGAQGQQAPTPSRKNMRVVSSTDVVKRLRKEREELIGTGAYDVSHPIIQSIDEKIAMQSGGVRDMSA